MKDSHKKRHETLHYKERRGEETGTGWLVMFPVHSSGPVIMDPAQSIKALRGKSERNAERGVGCVAV